MKRYKLTYLDCGEENFWFCNAYDAQHAEEKFWDSLILEGDAGIELIKISRVKKKKVNG